MPEVDVGQVPFGASGGTAKLAVALDRARAALSGLELGEAYDPAAPAAIVAAGLHLAPVPVEHGGLGIGPREAVELLAALAAIDGSTALGFAMHVHVVGSIGRLGRLAGGSSRAALRGYPRRRRAAQRGGHRGQRRKPRPRARSRRRPSPPIRPAAIA